MKNATCYLHGRDLRPTLCAECARAVPAPALAPTRTLQLTDTMQGQMRRVIDPTTGVVRFQLNRPIAVPDSRLQPWGAIWD